MVGNLYEKDMKVMKIYSFDGKKSNIDNIDLASSPLFLGQKYALNANDEAGAYSEKEETEEKPIEN